MKQAIVIIGIGELAGVFARGFLRCGHPVYPVTRGMNLQQQCQQIPTPAMVLIAVQEQELQPLLEHIPEPWKNKLALIQNELLPRDWEKHHFNHPTVTVVWFEKKKTLELTNILYSPSYGPNALIMSSALKALDVPAPILDSEQDLLYELLRKSLYILTVNIAGLVNNCTVEDLWMYSRTLATTVANEAISLLESQVKTALPREKLINGMVEGIHDCPHRNCQGRRAFDRLQRTLKNAQLAKIKTPKLEEIYHLVSQQNN